MPPAVVILAFDGVDGRDSERLRIRSYRAARLEVVGVDGMVSAFEPIWCTGVDGSIPDDVSDGVCGVPNFKGERPLFDDGVCGNGI